MVERVCPSPEELQRLVRGQTRGAAAEKLEAHFAECPACLAIVRAIDPDDGLSSALCGDQPVLPAIADHLLRRLLRLPESEVTPQMCSPESLLDPPHEPGEIGRLGSFSVLGVLGEGGMGVVYLARQTRPKRLVALKMLRDTGRERLARFRREAEVLARLHHPHIVQIYDVGEDASRPFLTMEYVQGGSLAQRLRVGPLPPREAAELLATLAGATTVAHAAGIIHRDLKPGNVLLDRSAGVPPATDDASTVAGGTPALREQPKITDFGLAKQLGDQNEGTFTGFETRTGAILGTPAYLAPELAGGHPETAGPAVDVYSLGAILYECLTGRPPFQGTSLLETLERVRTQEPVAPRKLNPGAPRDLETITLKCLQKDPARRYPSAQELANDLGRYLAGKPILARPTPLWVRAGKWVRRNRMWAAMIAVGFVSLLALVAGAVVYERKLQQTLTQSEANRDRADANYRGAQATIEQMLKRATDQRRSDIPRLRELRRELQEDAVGFFVTVAEQSGTREARVDAAFASLEAGRLRLGLNQPEQAKENLERASRLFTQLREEFPGEGKYRLGLAATYAAQASTAPTAAETAALRQEALALRRELVREAPDVTENQTALANSLHFLGYERYKSKENEEAVRYWGEASEILQRLLDEQPGSREFRYNLVLNQVNMSLLLQSQRSRRAEAERLHNEAEAHLEHLLRQDQRDYEATARLAILRVNWAYVLMNEGKLDVVEKDLEKNIATLEKGRRLEPEDGRIREALYSSHGVRSEVRQKQGRWADAVVDQRQVVALAANEPEANHNRLFLAMILARAKDHTGAMNEVEALAKIKQHNALANLLHLAKVCCWAARAAQEDATLSATQRSERAEQCCTRAVELLTRAKGLVAPKEWAIMPPELRKEEDYRPLWEREDFKRLLQ